MVAEARRKALPGLEGAVSLQHDLLATGGTLRRTRGVHVPSLRAQRRAAQREDWFELGLCFVTMLLLPVFGFLLLVWGGG